MPPDIAAIAPKGKRKLLKFDFDRPPNPCGNPMGAVFASLLKNDAILIR